MISLSSSRLPKVGDTVGAIQHYEQAGTHCAEVPRMLFERQRVDDLEDYISQVCRVERLHCVSREACFVLTICGHADRDTLPRALQAAAAYAA